MLTTLCIKKTLKSCVWCPLIQPKKIFQDNVGYKRQCTSSVVILVVTLKLNQFAGILRFRWCFILSKTPFLLFKYVDKSFKTTIFIFRVLFNFSLDIYSVQRSYLMPPHFLLDPLYVFTVLSVWKTTWIEHGKMVKWSLLKTHVFHACMSWTDEVRAVHVLRPGQVWQPCLLLD